MLGWKLRTCAQNATTIINAANAICVMISAVSVSVSCASTYHFSTPLYCPASPWNASVLSSLGWGPTLF
eukprot:scaffold110728_cov48-Prasinocladus_malaysianus.AAC.1